MTFNIQTVRQKIKEFITARVAIYAWDLDYPDTYYFTVNNQQYPANTLIELPIQNVIHSKEGYNSIITKARFPYRITYIFPGLTPYHDLPWSALEGILSNIHIFSLLQTPDQNIVNFQPAELEDSLNISRTDNQDGDWLVYLNFAFNTTFRTTDLSNIEALQPSDYFDTTNPPTLQELKLRIFRAKEGFKGQEGETASLIPIINDPTNFTLDSEIIINNK